MAVTEHASGTQSTTATTEHILTANPETTDGAYQVWLDLNDLSAAEDLIIRIKEKVLSGGTQRTAWEHYVAFTQGSEKIWFSPVFAAVHGWDVTLTSNTSSVSIPWSIRKLA